MTPRLWLHGDAWLTKSGRLMVCLSKAEEAEGERWGRLRHEAQRLAGRRDGKADPVQDGIDIDMSGGRREFALSKALGLRWTGRFHVMEEWMRRQVGDLPDVGDFEVRGTHLPSGRLIVKKRDRGDRIGILALDHMRPIYEFPGWLLLADGKREELWRTNVPKSCYMVPQEFLKPMRDLVIPTQYLAIPS